MDQVRGWGVVREGEGLESVGVGAAVVEARRRVEWWRWGCLMGMEVWEGVEWKRRWMGVEVGAALQGVISAGWSLRHRRAERSCVDWVNSILDWFGPFGV